MLKLLNNLTALNLLNVMTGNTRKSGKAMKQIASGENFSGAGDSKAAEYQISERMRVAIRSLNQNQQNVENGTSLLKVAEGGVQQQIELMKRAKQLVIDANNDTNSEKDIEALQQELDQIYTQIQDVAYETNYNGKYILLGTDISESIIDWQKLDYVQDIGDSQLLGLLNNGRQDDQFNAYQPYVFDFTGQTHDTLIDSTFSIGNKTYVFTEDGKSGGTPSGMVSVRAYFNANGTLDINSTGRELYSKLSANNQNSKMEISGQQVLITSGGKGAAVEVSLNDNLKNCNLVGNNAVDETLAGGQVGTASTASIDLTSLFGNFSGSGWNRKYLQIAVADEYGKLHSETYYLATQGTYNTYTDKTNVINISANFSANQVRDAILNSLNNSSLAQYATFGASSTQTITVTTDAKCAVANQSYYACGSSTTQTTGQITKPVIFRQSQKKNFKGGANPTVKAKATFNLSEYSTWDDVVKKLTGSAFFFEDSSKLPGDNPSPQTAYYAFVNSGSTDKNEWTSSVSGATAIDLAKGYALFQGNPNLTCAEVLAELFKTCAKETRFMAQGDTLTVSCQYAGTEGNGSRIKSLQKATLQQASGEAGQYYKLDFAKWFQKSEAEIDAAGGLANYLDGKGFCVDCASCDGEWSNFEFVTDKGVLRPSSAGTDIHNYSINVSGVTDAESLAQAIYDQGMPKLRMRNHFMFMELEKDGNGDPTGVVRLYDERLYKIDEGLAEVHDGIKSDWDRAYRDLYAEQLPIQHMDRSNMNIMLKIQRTTLDQIFNYNTQYHDISEYSLLKSDDERWFEYDLGVRTTRGFLSRKNEDGTIDKGELDKGLDYLLSANTLIGAQIKRLEYANENIVTQHENVTESESTIRDADMAQSMTDKVKYDLLAQASRMMLAQANQEPQGVLNLLP